MCSPLKVVLVKDLTNLKKAGCLTNSVTLISVVQRIEESTHNRVKTSEISLKLPVNLEISTKTKTESDFVVTIGTGKNQCQYIVGELKTFGGFRPEIRRERLRPVPLKPWKPAVKGTVERYAGILSETIPILKQVTNEELDQDIDELRS